METITIPKEKYEKIIQELKILRQLKQDEKETLNVENQIKEKSSDELLNQVKESLEDIKAGRVIRVA